MNYDNIKQYPSGAAISYPHTDSIQLKLEYLFLSNTAVLSKLFKIKLILTQNKYK